MCCLRVEGWFQVIPGANGDARRSGISATGGEMIVPKSASAIFESAPNILVIEAKR
jgi:hypothetical protein